MIDFECRYVLNVPAHMNDACWTGYILDLYTVPSGGYARLVFNYPDNGLFDVRLLLQSDTDPYTRVSLLNLNCSFCTRNTYDIETNARLMYDAGLNIDAASGVATALCIITNLLDCSFYERYQNIADFFGLSISVDDFINSFCCTKEHTELPF